MLVAMGKPTRSVTRIGRWREVFLVVGVFLIAMCLFYYEVIFLGRTFVPTHAIGVMGTSGPYGYTQPFRPDFYRIDLGASAWQTEPWTWKVAREYGHGRFPLWNEHQGFGSPMLANAQSGGMDLLRLPILLSTSPLAWDAYYLIRTLAGFLATYGFASAVGLVLPARLFLAIAFVFSGHFLMLGNNTWVAAYFLLPVILLGTEWMVTGRSRLGFVATALAVGMNLLVGMPEATLFVFLFGAGYGGVRLLGLGWGRRFQEGWLRRAAALVGAWVIGMALAAPLLFTLFEYASHSSKRAGERTWLGQFHEPLSNFFVWFIPHLNGRPLDPGAGHYINTYVGIVVIFLASYGLAPMRGGAYWRLAPFSFIAAALLLAKIYGVPGINDVGKLPIFNITLFQKWSGPVTAFALVLLAGLGVHRLVVDQMRPTLASVSLVIANSLVIAGLLVNWDKVTKVATLPIWRTLGLAFAFAVAIWAVIQLRRWLSPSLIGLACCGLVMAELFVYGPRSVYQDRYDRFVIPPYIQFFAQHAKNEPFRIFAKDGYLFPNSATVYQLDDIRSLDALYVDRYLIYIQTFINSGVTDRYTGFPLASGEHATRYIGNPWFDLTGVKYIITGTNSPSASELRGNIFTEEVVKLASSKCPGRNPPCAHLEPLTINGVTKTLLFEHPPAEIIYPLTVTPDRSLLRFSLAMSPKVWEPEHGDGVRFMVGVEVDNRRHLIYNRDIDPKRLRADRRWIDDHVDLSAFIGREVQLVFITDPLQSSAADWAGWADIRLEGTSAASIPQYSLVYDNEVQIFENRHAMPRAFLVTQVLPVPDVDAAIALMKHAGIDPRSTAVVEGPPSDQVTMLAGSGGSATIKNRTSTEIVLEVDADGPSFLVLTDAFYPGWVALLDGQEASMYATNVAFRGVFVPSGRHQVVFTYRPGSFYLGLSFTVFSGIILIVVIAQGALHYWRTWLHTRQSRRVSTSA
jgi:hypothetical protein